jgi:acetyltransferase-like isoleucine patch superfamily enzyme
MIKIVCNKIINRLKNVFLISPLLKLSVLKYRLLSDWRNTSGRPVLHCPTYIDSKGRITFKTNVHLGVCDSPYAFSGYSFISARSPKASITFCENVYLNNNAVIISDGEGIEIGSNTIIGFNFCAFDTDFHSLKIDQRMTGIPKTKKVVIGQNVFIGSNVTILKGVTIGDNTVIGAGSIVTGSLPANVIAGGNPCKVIKPL